MSRQPRLAKDVVENLEVRLRQACRVEQPVDERARIIRGERIRRARSNHRQSIPGKPIGHLDFAADAEFRRRRIRLGQGKRLLTLASP